MCLFLFTQPEKFLVEIRKLNKSRCHVCPHTSSSVNIFCSSEVSEQCRVNILDILETKVHVFNRTQTCLLSFNVSSCHSEQILRLRVHHVIRILMGSHQQCLYYRRKWQSCAHITRLRMIHYYGILCCWQTRLLRSLN